MEIFTFSANIHLGHPSFDPAIISAERGMEPKVAWRAGQDWRRSDGTKIGSGIHEHTYWASHPKRGEDDELLEVLASDLALIEQKRKFIEDFIETSGRFTYYVS